MRRWCGWRARAEGGNVTPAVEYNVHADPEAAAVVLRLGGGLPLTLVPLDVTHRVRLTPARLARLRRIAAGRAGIPMHDPCVVAHLLRPGLFTGRRINVAVETSSPLTLGMTVADWYGVSGRPANATYLDRADAEGFFALLFERPARLP